MFTARFIRMTVGLLAMLVFALTAVTASASYLTWGSLGVANGQLNNPQAVAVLPNGDVLVGENHRLQRFTAEGTFKAVETGAPNGTLALAQTGDGGFWADRVRYSSSGTVIATGMAAAVFGSEAAAPSGYVYVGLGLGCQVGEFSGTDGKPLQQFGACGAGPGQFGSFSFLGVATAPDGTVYVGDSGNHRIEHFSAAGAFLGTFGAPGAGAGQLGTGPSNAISVGVDAAGNIYAVAGGGGGAVGSQGGDPACRIEKFSPAGASIGEAFPQTPGTCTFYSGLAVAAPNTVYVTNFAGLNTVTRIDDTPAVALLTSTGHPQLLTGQTATIVAATSTPFDAPQRYQFDLDGSGAFATDAGASPQTTVSYPTPGARHVSVRLTTAAGKQATASFDVSVAQAPPPPPPGPVGISINNADYATNNPIVRLNLVWPASASQALIANDGGFGLGAATLALSPQIPWRLQQTGAERLPKTVYARFLGAGADTQTFTDDIVLDQTPPTIESATFTGSSPATAGPLRAKRTYGIKIRAADAIVGVCAIQTSPRRAGGLVMSVQNCHKKGVLRLAKTVRPRSGTSAAKWIRVENSAGTWSRWVKIRAPKTHQ